jgi:glyoxylase-like metal-dependent hydrolase (beta-lactamase superfamily II)
MVHSISNSGISNCYLISGRDGLIAVDVGSITAADALIRFINASPDLSFSDVRYIAATHFHIDHIGGIGRFLKRCPGQTKVLFHHYVRDYLDGTRKLSPMQNWMTGLLPSAMASMARLGRPSGFFRLRSLARLPFDFECLCGIPVPGLRNIVRLPYPRERIVYLGDGKSQRYRLGFDDWGVIETPGHTEDSISFYNEKTAELICGDLILNLGKEGFGVLNRFHWDRRIMMRSYRTLYDTIAPKVIYPGHGEAIRSDVNALRKINVFGLRGYGRFL